MFEKVYPGKITAILLSWRRLKNVQRIIDELAGSSMITEIMLWNNDPDVKLDFPGVITVNSPRNYLCFARYCLAPLASQNTIWFQDDDLLITRAQLDTVYSAYIQDTSRVYGTVGRDVVNGFYTTDTVYGECDIVLGQAMLFNRKLLHYAFGPFGSMPPDMTEDDIVFSMATPRRPFAVDISPIEDLGSGDDAALWKKPGHFERRQKAVDFMLAWRSRAAQE